jgi:hypothetical protein
MPNVTAILHDLQRQRNEVQAQINRLDTAIATLSGVGGRGKGRRGGKRYLSAAARNRIAAAQRARWAKWKAMHEKK